MERKIMMLQFSKANTKLEKLAKAIDGNVYSFDLPAGYACPFAKDCLSKCINGKIEDGKDTVFRCFSASSEVLYPKTHAMRMRNLEGLRTAKTTEGMFNLLAQSMPKDAKVIRFHVSGDFFSLAYFRAAIALAKANPSVLFYAYTKSLPFWILEAQNIPKNFNLVASYGGKHDRLIEVNQLRFAKVVYSRLEAHSMGLPVDTTDKIAALSKMSFALVVHGPQPKGSEAAIAWAKVLWKSRRNK